ncbi:hypothetical protein ABE504_18805 [Paenibacillus oryzisoli]|uniref:hypothetical protein n=1 Tax=Paenibacillus oryzisoli TaxID=1850517 RepID=UPI003D2714DF
MKLRIEKWVEETMPFAESDSADELFEESVRCFKIGAYKSAFIMSYLSFKVTIKDRILSCRYGKELPNKNPENPFFWEMEIVKILEKPDKWENRVNDIVEASCAKSKKDIAIIHFKDEEQIKTAYNHWKDIRNECTHAKGQTTIDSATVECFWNFMMDNLGKFYVLGGEEYLLRELENLYKFYRYPEIVEPESVKTIMYDVNVICQKSPGNFLETLFENLKKTARGDLVNDENFKFWKYILETSHENVMDGIVKIISNDAQHFFNFYSYFPQLLEMSISLNSKFIVNELSNWLKHPDFFYGSEKTFWVALVEVLDRYREHVDVDKIINNRTIGLIEYFEKSERNLRILNGNDVFKKYIFEVSSWFFKTDASSQYNNFSKLRSKDSENIELCFNYLEWDSVCIGNINYALDSLKSSMASRSNYYSEENGYYYKSIIKRIICNNKDKISNVPNINTSDYSHVFDIINDCKSDQN